jgi:hypothetical protein
MVTAVPPGADQFLEALANTGIQLPSHVPRVAQNVLQFGIEVREMLLRIFGARFARALRRIADAFDFVAGLSNIVFRSHIRRTFRPRPTSSRNGLCRHSHQHRYSRDVGRDSKMVFHNSDTVSPFRCADDRLLLRP